MNKRKEKKVKLEHGVATAELSAVEKAVEHKKQFVVVHAHNAPRSDVASAHFRATSVCKQRTQNTNTAIFTPTMNVNAGKTSRGSCAAHAACHLA